MSTLIAAANSSVGSALFAVLLVFLVLAAIYWVVGYFQVPPMAHKIVGVVCAVIFVLYALSRFGILPSVSL